MSKDRYGCGEKYGSVPAWKISSEEKAVHQGHVLPHIPAVQPEDKADIPGRKQVRDYIKKMELPEEKIIFKARPDSSALLLATIRVIGQYSEDE